MMATQIYIGYVIAIILILSNVKNVSSNKNNQYATTTTAFSTAIEGTDGSVAVSTTQQFHTTVASVYPMSKMVTVRSAEIKSISALHDRVEFMQQTLHNTSSTIDEELNQPHKQKEVHKQVERPLSNSGNNGNSISKGNGNIREQQRQREYLVQPDAENSKQLLSTMHSLSMVDLQPTNPNEQRHNQARVTQQHNDKHSATPLTYHDKFMNENKKAPNAIESNTAEIASETIDKIRNIEANKRNQPMERISDEESNNHDDDNNDDSRESDEITSTPMKIVRDNVNATSDTVFRVNDESDGITKANKTFAVDNDSMSTDGVKNLKHTNGDGVGSEFDSDALFSIEDSSNIKFNERSRYLETDLHDFNGEPQGSVEQSDANVSDQLDWPSDANKFEELTLNEDDDDDKSTSSIESRRWTKDSPSIESLHAESITASPAATQNIFKISKPNKSKSMKRLAAAPPQLPQALLEIRLNKSPPVSTTNEKQFINSLSFRYIANLYDQYEWDADDLRNVLSPRCASDMYVYLDALAKGRVWAAKASDASGRYRGQFLFENNHWLGSMIVCDELAKIDGMELNFFVATTLIHSPEPLIKKHILRVGQCLPRVCTTDDVKLILNMDISARKFTENFMNATTEAGKGEIVVLGVRRVPGEYNAWKDRQFYLVAFICITFAGLSIWATIYENSLAKSREMDDEMVSPSRQAIHPIHMTKTTKSNGQRIYTYENNTINMESSEPAFKMDKIHANNIINGCTFELHPISIEHNHGNHLANNNNRTALYRLNNNNANNINNNHHAGNNDDAIDNNHLKRAQHSRNGSTYGAKQFDKHDANHLSVRQRLLLSFGLSTNIKTILSTKKLPQESIGCIHGLRVFSMMWTILVHTYLQLFAVSENRYSKILTEKAFWFQILGNASYTVDTFFFISGFLVTLLFLRAKTSTKSSNEGSFLSGAKQSLLLVLYRYIRLTPVYFMVIVINAVSLKYIYNKSVFTPGLPDHLTCPQYWWRNILYIQTWFPFPQLCMLWSWYLADDMQFYVWAIIILILSRRHGRTAVALIVVFLLSSWVVSALVSLNFNYTHKVAEPLESFGYLYEKPWTRLGPYVMGMIAGYILNRYPKSAPSAITPFINVVLWLMSLGVMLLLVFGVWNGTLNLLWTALYVSLGHSAWGMALIWIVLSCKWGLAKPIDRLLSLRTMLPLSRLTYCAYLVHPVTQICTSLDLKGTLHLQHGLVFTVFLGNVVTSYAIALILSLLFEAPIVRLLKILFSK